MKIETVHEHSYCPELLPANAIIADIGCRNFLWTNHFRELGHTVHAVDIDDLQGGEYDRCAITDYTGFCGIVRNNDPQATKVGPINHFTGEQVMCYTLDEYSRIKKVKFWDLVKMDIEKSEFEVIMNLKRPLFNSLSLECHLHCGQTMEECQLMFTHLAVLGYQCVSGEELTEMHGAGRNFWNMLWILK